MFSGRESKRYKLVALSRECGNRLELSTCLINMVWHSYASLATVQITAFLAQALIDKIVGSVMLLASAIIFAYYTTWVVITVRACA